MCLPLSERNILHTYIPACILLTTHGGRSANYSTPTNTPSGEEETVAKGRASDAVHGARVPVVSLEVLLVVADGTLVDQPVLGAGEVRRPVTGREVKRQAAGLPRNHALRVACKSKRVARSVYAFVHVCAW